MQTTPENSPLASIFEELRALPLHPPRREMLAGLRWKNVFQTPVWFFFPFLILFCFFPFLIAQSAQSNRARNQRATARVIQAESFDNPQGGQPQTFLKYRFRHNGRDYTGATLAWGTSPLTPLRAGNSLEVAFDKAQPQRSVPAFQIAQNEPPWFVFLLFPLFFAVFLLPLLAPQLRTVLLARRLFARGVLTTGHLKFVKSTPMQTPFMPLGSSQLIYEFDDQNGHRQRGATRCDSSWLTMQLPPQSPLVVAYNSQKPRENIVLEPFVA
ncbi:MAG: hypothetical protein KY445_05440 [Armatimonadetes bacterium]|nr:hypothetical protein [Armatimonadota bacterium]